MSKQTITEAVLVEEAILENETLVESIKESAEKTTEPMTMDAFTQWLDQSPK
jgi:hypothetical protein